VLAHRTSLMADPPRLRVWPVNSSSPAGADGMRAVQADYGQVTKVEVAI
jgi:hypothetical protein